MNADALSLAGGFGLFLYGMQAMTEALRRLGGRRLRAILARFTRTPLSGAAAGAVATAVLQSSSATILTVIGFVSAGLMTFPQALGVVMGANVGTTATGWMVAILGLKLHLGTLAMPLLFAAALAMLLGREGLGRAGGALAGFALVFLGIDIMQNAMAAVEPALAAVLAGADTLPGRLALVATGAAFTAVIQSSGAGVAAVLVLFAGGAVDLLQAGALVIGMDIGTSAKTLVVTAGKPVDARRTAYAHVGFNLVTALFAFACLDLLPALGAMTGNGPTAITAFYTLFNLSGAILILPFAGSFARMIVRLVPGREGSLPDPPDPDLLDEPETALDAVRATTDRIAAAVAADIARTLSGEASATDPDAARRAVEESEGFVTRIGLPGGREGPLARAAALMHRIDHLHRLLDRAGQVEREALLRRTPGFERVTIPLGLMARHLSRHPSDATTAGRLGCLSRQIGRRAQDLRRRMLVESAADGSGVTDVFDMTDALRWAERTAGHLERIGHYGTVASAASPTHGEARRRSTED
ncbi:MAG: Na/Pi cotransporter family protein [Paracoccaceae bacterium]